MRWYISFHGGDDTHDWNNIHAFDRDGVPQGKMLDTRGFPSGLALRELRGFVFGPDGDLYVANAWRDASQVLRFAGTLDKHGRHAFRDVYVEQHHANPGLSHPFDVSFGADGHCFVPSQDTNVVGRYFGPGAAGDAVGKPMPVAQALASAASEVPPGTFVASEKHSPHGIRAVRRTIFGPQGTLFVADRDANSVKRYDGITGAFLREYQDDALVTPVHLLWDEARGRLLVGTRDASAILTIDPESGDIATFVNPGAGGLKGPAGMAFGPDGAFYVCSRETRQILRFDPHTGAPDTKPFIDNLDDFPEFILHVP